MQNGVEPASSSNIPSAAGERNTRLDQIPREEHLTSEDWAIMAAVERCTVWCSLKSLNLRQREKYWQQFVWSSRRRWKAMQTEAKLTPRMIFVIGEDAGDKMRVGDAKPMGQATSSRYGDYCGDGSLGSQYRFWRESQRYKWEPHERIWGKKYDLLHVVGKTPPSLTRTSTLQREKEIRGTRTPCSMWWG